MKHSISRTGWPAERRLRFVQACTRGVVAAAALFVSGMADVLSQEPTSATPVRILTLATPSFAEPAGVVPVARESREISPRMDRLGSMVGAASVAQEHDLDPTVAARGSSLLAKLPLDFVENRGQWNTSTKFIARKGAIAATFERDGIKLQLGKDRSTTLSFTFEGAATETALVGEDKRSGHYNFFLGNDPTTWHSNVAAYSSLRYRGLYDGIDVRVREQTGQLEYELLLAPGANLEKAVIRVEGALGLELADDGALIFKTSAGPLRQTPPVTWEESPSGEKRPIESRFRIIDAQRYGLKFPDAISPSPSSSTRAWSGPRSWGARTGKRSTAWR